MRLENVEHQVDDDAGDADVKPDGKGPACDGPMAPELALPGPANGDGRENGDGGGEQNVGDQDRIIDRTEQTRSPVMNGAHPEVIDDIADEKGDGDGEGGEHGALVGFYPAGADERITPQQQRGGGGVEGSVDGGENGNGH